MNKCVLGMLGLATCMAMAPLLAHAGDAAQVYTFRVDVDGNGVLWSVQPVGPNDATTAQLQRELTDWLVERSGDAGGGAVTTWVRVNAIPGRDGASTRVLSASAGPAPEALTRPDYPANARRQGREGVVVLELAMDADGAVADAAVHGTFGAVDRAMANAALAAARNWSFRPETVDGAPQAGKLLMPVCFTVSDARACEWTGPNAQLLGRDNVLALAPAVRLTLPAGYAVK